MAILRATSILCAVFTIQRVSWGIPLDLGICGNKNLPCQCGTPGYTFHLEIKQCTRFYRWKAQCKPCQNINEQVLCNQYRHCLECNANIDGCEGCPAGRYGKWCQRECDCQNGGWCDNTGRCTCPAGYQGNKCEKTIALECPPLQLLDHGRIVHGTRVHFVCEQGYSLIGPSSTTCQEDGIWSSSSPECVPSTECPHPTIPANSIIRNSFPKVSFSPGSTLSLRCKKGYVLVGKGTLTCEVTGKWSEEPAVCVRADETCVDPGRLVNGKVKVGFGIDGGELHAMGTVLEFCCEPSFVLIGSTQANCFLNGTWSTSLPKCVQGTCSCTCV